MTAHSPPRSARLIAASVLSLLGLAGCGEPGPKVYPITGAVTYMGKPVKGGKIRLEPVGEKMDPRASPEVVIKDGRYNVPGGNRGVQGGTYVVYILAADGEARDELPYGMPLFPPYYVTKVELPAEGGTFDFQIPEQKGTRR
jgi:hypothetical protein